MSLRSWSTRARYEAARYEAARYEAARYEAARYEAARCEAARYEALPWTSAVVRAGRLDQARLAFEKMLTYANHLGLYAEQIGHTGEQQGNFPQVAVEFSGPAPGEHRAPSPPADPDPS
jgi:hypothetical protein